MQSLSSLDVEEKLSFAYLFAVTSHARMSCREAVRSEDNNGIDATIVAWPPFPNGGRRTEIDIKVQLKATIKAPTDSGTHLDYWVKELARFNALRDPHVFTPRVLVVLFLPRDPSQWLEHSAEQLVLRRCAYWVSLRGAPDPDTGSGARVWLPKSQAFSPPGVLQLASSLSHDIVPTYQAP